MSKVWSSGRGNVCLKLAEYSLGQRVENIHLLNTVVKPHTDYPTLCGYRY